MNKIMVEVNRVSKVLPNSYFLGRYEDYTEEQIEEYNIDEYDYRFDSAPYHFVYIEGFGWSRAMFLNNEWYSSYTSKIIRPVLYWIAEFDPRKEE